MQNKNTSTTQRGNLRPDLSDAGFVRLPTVMELLGVSAATVWRMAADGRLPKPRKISTNVTGWNVGEIKAALRKVAA